MNLSASEMLMLLGISLVLYAVRHPVRFGAVPMLILLGWYRGWEELRAVRDRVRRRPPRS